MSDDVLAESPEAPPAPVQESAPDSMPAPQGPTLVVPADGPPVGATLTDVGAPGAESIEPSTEAALRYTPSARVAPGIPLRDLTAQESEIWLGSAAAVVGLCAHGDWTPTAALPDHLRPAAPPEVSDDH